MAKQTITSFFNTYITALKQYDLQAICESYHFPCSLHTPDKIVLLNSINDCEKEFNVIFEQLKQAKMSNVNTNNLSYSNVSQSLLLVNIDWEFIDEHGEIFADFCAVYHVLLINKAFKIINVVSHELSNSLVLDNVLEISKNDSLKQVLN